jgi:hypothetical protein
VLERDAVAAEPAAGGAGDGERPRVIPAPPKPPPTDAADRDRRTPPGQRDLVVASVIRCPPRTSAPPHRARQ